MQRQHELFHQRESLHHAYQAKVHEIKARKGGDKEMVYPNQQTAATEIIQELFDPTNSKVAVTLIALPQVGKTGTFLEVAYKACTHPSDDCIIDPRNVFIITGMSDRDWQKQTEADMLEAFKRRVYHRGRLNTKDREDNFYTALSNTKNALIILDECHIGAEKEHQVSQMLRRLNLLSIDTLRERNVKILEVSATPGATLYDTEKWGSENHSIVMLYPSSKYVGFRQFLVEGRIHPSYDLTNEDELEKLVAFMKRTYPTPRWHIVRLPAKSRKNGEFEEKLHQICAREGWNIEKHSANDRVGDIDYHMGMQPRQHTILLIKEFWRAGKRLNDTYMGVVHEPKTVSMDTNVTAQGLVGRLCGNDKQSGADSSHMFCDIDRIHEYLAWIDARGDWSKVREYNSRCLTIKKGRVVVSKPTFADLSDRSGDKKSSNNVPDECNPKTVPQVFNLTAEEYASFHKSGHGWNREAIFAAIKKYKPKLVEQLRKLHQLQITESTTINDTYKKRIVDFVEAAKKNVPYTLGTGMGITEDSYQIFLDRIERRVIVSIYMGSMNKSAENDDVTMITPSVSALLSASFGAS
jgi:hypothetical protein